MDAITKEVLARNEEMFLIESKTDPVLQAARSIGIEQNLTTGQVALLVLPELLKLRPSVKRGNEHRLVVIRNILMEKE